MVLGQCLQVDTIPNCRELSEGDSIGKKERKGRDQKTSSQTLQYFRQGWQQTRLDQHSKAVRQPP